MLYRIDDPNYLQGRVDAQETCELRKQQLNESSDAYQMYCKGFASMRASIDADNDLMTNISAWPLDAQSLYNDCYERYRD
jgi:hypothetical protein